METGLRERSRLFQLPGYKNLFIKKKTAIHLGNSRDELGNFPQVKDSI